MSQPPVLLASLPGESPAGDWILSGIVGTATLAASLFAWSKSYLARDLPGQLQAAQQLAQQLAASTGHNVAQLQQELSKNLPLWLSQLQKNGGNVAELAQRLPSLMQQQLTPPATTSGSPARAPGMPFRIETHSPSSRPTSAPAAPAQTTVDPVGAEFAALYRRGTTQPTLAPSVVTTHRTQPTQKVTTQAPALPSPVDSAMLAIEDWRLAVRQLQRVEPKQRDLFEGMATSAEARLRQALGHPEIRQLLLKGAVAANGGPPLQPHEDRLLQMILSGLSNALGSTVMDGVQSAVTGQPTDTQRGALIAFALGMIIPGGHGLIRRAQENAAACVAETASRQLFGLEAKDPKAIAVNALFCSGAGVLAEGFLSMLGRLYRRTGQPAVVVGGAPVLRSQAEHGTVRPTPNLMATQSGTSSTRAGSPRIFGDSSPQELNRQLLRHGVLVESPESHTRRPQPTQSEMSALVNYIDTHGFKRGKLNYYSVIFSAADFDLPKNVNNPVLRGIREEVYAIVMEMERISGLPMELGAVGLKKLPEKVYVHPHHDRLFFRYLRLLTPEGMPTTYYSLGAPVTPEPGKGAVIAGTKWTKKDPGDKSKPTLAQRLGDQGYDARYRASPHAVIVPNVTLKPYQNEGYQLAATGSSEPTGTEVWRILLFVDMRPKMSD